MANLSKSYTLFAFTSPRTIEKIIPEIALLIENFTGEIWIGSSQLQSDFFDVLFDSEFYEGEIRPSDAALAARDRITRAPKALGFVNLEPIIELTDAGEKLLSGKRTGEVITRQLLKFQLPSPYHTDNKDRFFVKPYLELLRLVYELDGLSKTEIALFFSQLTHLDKYETVKKKILDFRTERKQIKTNRKEFVQKRFNEEIEEIFEEEIETKGYRTRESADTSEQKFFKTKQSNMRDYADAFIRYLRATELVTFNARQARLVVSKFKTDEVLFILKNIQRKPYFGKTSDFKKNLFDSTSPALLTDDKKLLTEKIRKLDETKADSKFDAEQLKDILVELEEKHKSEVLQTQKQKLKTYEELPDILEVFERIKNRELPDAPLFLEWNIWRAMEMLNYGQINGNFVTDLDGAPLSTASAKKPDIECDYENFKLIIEVTMSSGQKQYDMEGEPVARHYGDAKRESAEKPVYCLFIAPKVSEGTLAHFHNLNKMNTRFYGGKTQIVPMSLETFIKFSEIGVQKKFSRTEILEKFFSQAIEANSKSEDEQIWFSEIEKMVETWT